MNQPRSRVFVAVTWTSLVVFAAWLPARAAFDADRGIITGESWASGVPLGGIGCGKIEILTDGWFGNLTAHHNWDRPTGRIRGAFAAIRVATPKRTEVRILRAAADGEYAGVAGIPEVRYAGFYPRAGVRFQDELMPLRIALHGFSPLIPGHPEDSSLPGMLLEYRLTNLTLDDADVSLALAWPNLLGKGGTRQVAWEDLSGGTQEAAEAGTLAGLVYRTSLRYDDERRNVLGDYFVGVETGDGIEASRCASWDAAADTPGFWPQFLRDGTLPATADAAPREPAGAVAARLRVPAGESRLVRFFVAWNLPHHVVVHDRRVPGEGWVDASEGVRNAFDGARHTRWTTGHPMLPGEVFEMRWATDLAIERIRLDSGPSPHDYPRGCRIEWLDGEDEAAEVQTFDAETCASLQRLGVLDLPAPGVTARGVRIVQTGAHPSWFWSIHELELFGAGGTPLEPEAPEAVARTPAFDTVRVVEDVGHYHSRRFASAAEVAAYLAGECNRLQTETRRWQDMIVASNLPFWLKLKLVNSAFTMFANTVLTRDGDFAVLESPVDMNGALGTMDQRLAAHAFYTQMFPELDKSEMRLFARCQQPDGRITHFNGNVHEVIGSPDVSYGITDWPDLSCSFVMQVLKLYRWTGDVEFLNEMAPHAFRALDWLEQADTDGDLIPEGGSTYDYEILPRGAFVYNASCMLGALKAGEAIAQHVGDKELASRLKERGRATAASVVDVLWDGDRFVKWASPLTGERVPNTFIASYAGDWMSRLSGLGPTLADEYVVPGVERLLANHLHAFPIVPPMEVSPEGAMTSPACYILQHEPYLGCQSIYTGFVDDGLEVLRRVYLLAWEGNRSPWNQSLSYAAPLGEQGGLVTYMTSPTTWHVLNALAGASLNARAGYLYLDPKTSAQLPELHVPLFFPGWWAWLDYAPQRNVFALTVVKVFEGTDLTIEYVWSHGDHRTWVRPFKVEEGAVLPLKHTFERLDLPTEPRTVAIEPPRPDREDIGHDPAPWILRGFHGHGLRALPGHARMVCDGQLATRWSTGRSMKPGDWIEIDLGEPREIGHCVMDLGAWASDYPRGLRIETSDDGTAWSVAAEHSAERIVAAARESRISLDFGPVTARRIRLVQIGAAEPWWSIAELYLAAP